MSDTPQETPAEPRRAARRPLARGILRCCRVFLLLLALYLLGTLVGLLPVNNDFAPTAGGVEVMVVSTAVHADLVLPVRNETVDWGRYLSPGDFAGDVRGATHVAFGWGSEEFYVNTRTWADVKAGTVFRALFWPSASCAHVNMWDGVPAGARKTRISREQYRRLVDYILNSFRRDEGGRFMVIRGGAYGADDAFYQAHGSYHRFNTCNCWVGGGLRAAGVRAGWFTPLPKTPSLYLPDAQAE